MTRLMFDSTTPWDIPRDAEMVAYYVDGAYAWPQGWIDLFPRAVKVPISAIGRAVAKVGDVEVGCIWPPANAVPWVRRARKAGYDPTIYVNELNDWAIVRQAFRDANEPEPHYWTARYNGVREIPPGAVARQFAHPHDGDGIANRPWETGKHYDLSVVTDFWPGIDNGEDKDMTPDESAALWELHMVLVSGAKRDAKFNADLGYVLDQLGAKVDALATKVDAIELGGINKEEIAEIAKDAISDDLKNDEE